MSIILWFFSELSDDNISKMLNIYTKEECASFELYDYIMKDPRFNHIIFIIDILNDNIIKNIIGLLRKIEAKNYNPIGVAVYVEEDNNAIDVHITTYKEKICDYFIFTVIHFFKWGLLYYFIFYLTLAICKKIIYGNNINLVKETGLDVDTLLFLGLSQFIITIYCDCDNV